MHITVIAKTPVAGRVKTRLCPPCSYEQASELAAAALADTFDAVDRAVERWTSMLTNPDDRDGAPPVRRVLLLDGEPADWFPAHYDIVQQCDGDLGTRLAHGFATLGPGIIVAMDSPFVAGFAIDAIESIGVGHDAIGFTDDGGYWGIALATITGTEFDDVVMSTDHTGADQHARLIALGRVVDLLPPGRDIDTFDDVIDLANSRLVGRTITVARTIVDAVAMSTTHEVDRAPGNVADTINPG
jgi:uncharacterized protein